MQNIDYQAKKLSDLAHDENLMKNLPEEAKKIMELLDQIEDFTLALRKKMLDELREKKS